MESSPSLELKPLAPYEDHLLSALAFFRTKRDKNTQAHHCLSMYLRQSEQRILSEVEFYAHRCGMHPLDFLALIAENPEQAEDLIEKVTLGSVSPVAKDS